MDLIPEIPQPSKPNSLNWTDIEEWAKETLIFTSPAIIIFLTQLQLHGDFNIALGAAYSAILTSLINLFGKYKGQ